jgi:hypothetical protein
MIYNLIFSGSSDPFATVKIKAKVHIGHNVRFKGMIYRVNHIELNYLYIGA